MKLIMPAAMAAIITLSACATVKPVPTTRKLTPELMTQMKETDVVLTKNEDGIRAGWTSAAAAPTGYTDYSYMAPPGTSPAAAGIGGALGQAIGAAIVDAAPSARAKRSVAAINTGIDKSELDAALIRKIKAARSEGDVKIGEISTQTFERKDPDPMDTLKIVSSYTLAEDASALRVKADVTYQSEILSYRTPYDFGEKVPKSEMQGPLYRNSFSYHSDKFDVPELTEEVRAQLVQSINNQYKEDMAAEPTEKEAKKLTKNRDKALEKAKDDKLSKTERATLLIGQWRGSGSPVLQEAISEGQDFIAEMLVMDLNNSDVPQFERKVPLEKKNSFWTGVALVTDPIGQNEYTVLDTKTDGRKVLRIDSGINAGAYVSHPANGFATYGNTYKTAR